MDQHKWVHSSKFQPLPLNAVVGGHDCDGSPIYVGRAFHNGEFLPAKVIPSKGCAYVAHCHKEHAKDHYEVLVGHGYVWVVSANGRVPPHAVCSGRTRTGEPLYVGRAHYSTSLVVGKVHPSHGCLYIPFCHEEIKLQSYEVLMYRGKR